MAYAELRIGRTMGKTRLQKQTQEVHTSIAMSTEAANVTRQAGACHCTHVSVRLHACHWAHNVMQCLRKQ